MYAQNYLLPVELAHCRQLGLRFLPMEAEIVQRQLLGTPALMKKVQELSSGACTCTTQPMR